MAAVVKVDPKEARYMQKSQPLMAFDRHVLRGATSWHICMSPILSIILISIQGGSGNKWQTPHAAAKSATYTPRGGSIDPGDVGIWATCMKAKEGKATIELKSLFEEVDTRSSPSHGS